jgi:hypothetical protein
MFELCIVSKDKSQNAGQSGQRHKYDKVQCTREYKTNPGGGDIFRTGPHWF